jgi:pantoate--beta-alanine ligase
MVQPDLAVFGEKDFQQLLVIRQMVADLDLPIEIIGAEIKREADGLAMSSRNSYLGPAERQNSRVLSESLKQLCQDIEQGISIEQAEKNCSETLKSNGFVVDYVTLRETEGLKKVSEEQLISGRKLIVLAAAKLGSTRLIDNLKFSVGL